MDTVLNIFNGLIANESVADAVFWRRKEIRAMDGFGAEIAITGEFDAPSAGVVLPASVLKIAWKKLRQDGAGIEFAANTAFVRAADGSIEMPYLDIDLWPDLNNQPVNWYTDPKLTAKLRFVRKALVSRREPAPSFNAVHFDGSRIAVASPFFMRFTEFDTNGETGSLPIPYADALIAITASQDAESYIGFADNALWFRVGAVIGKFPLLSRYCGFDIQHVVAEIEKSNPQPTALDVNAAALQWIEICRKIGDLSVSLSIDSTANGDVLTLCSDRVNGRAPIAKAQNAQTMPNVRLSTVFFPTDIGEATALVYGQERPVIFKTEIGTVVLMVMRA